MSDPAKTSIFERMPATLRERVKHLPQCVWWKDHSRCDCLPSIEDVSGIISLGLHAEDQRSMDQPSVPPKQPEPKPNGNPAILDLVKADIQARDSLGLQTYGVRLQGFNGRDALWDAYAEALDLAFYLRQAIWERENPLNRVG